MTTGHEHAAPPRQRSELWSLREDVNVELDADDGPVRLRGRWGDVTIGQPSPLVREALSRMRLGPISLENAISGAQAGLDRDTMAAHGQELRGVFERLQPLIIRSLRLSSGQPLLSVVPLTVRSRFHPVPLAAAIPVRLSTFAELRTDGNAYCIESPLALHRVLLHRAEAMTLIASLASPVTPAALATAVPPIGPLTDAVLEYLAAAGMVVQAATAPGGLPVFAEDTDPALAGWSPIDMMFHTRSTLGRHDHNFGITYPAGRTTPAEPVVKPQANRYIELHRPRWEELCESDPPLTAAIEGRRSMRRHGARPITLVHLGDLLYRTARVRSLISSGPGRPPGPAGSEAGPEAGPEAGSEAGPEAGSEAGPEAGSEAGPEAGSEAGPEAGYELSDRPYPSGGACYEIEFYVTAGQCEGLAPGAYHYDPLGHRLEPIAEDGRAVQELLGCAGLAAALDGPPPVLICMTVRFRRLSWKYEGLAYRMVLMHVGVLIQSLYLVCTAMRLAPCALSSVSIEAAARAFGTDWRTEPCVGQFIVGGAREAAGPDTSHWRDVNDAHWAELARAYRKPPR